MPLSEPSLRVAAGLDPNIETTLGAQDAAIHALPEFSTEFKSAYFPALDGPVVMRYGSVADSLHIERLIGPLGGFVAEAIASLHVLVSKAPASWYRAPEKGGGVPVLDLNRLPDVEGILELYRNYSKWRAAFRSGNAPVELDPA